MKVATTTEAPIDELQIVTSVVVAKYVEVPQIQKRIIEKPVEVVEEEIIEIPKIEYVEEIVERHVCGKTNWIAKYVEVPQQQKRIVHKPVEEIVEVGGGRFWTVDSRTESVPRCS